MLSTYKLHENRSACKKLRGVNSIDSFSSGVKFKLIQLSRRHHRNQCNCTLFLLVKDLKHCFFVPCLVSFRSPLLRGYRCSLQCSYYFKLCTLENSQAAKPPAHNWSSQLNRPHRLNICPDMSAFSGVYITTLKYKLCASLMVIFSTFK